MNDKKNKKLKFVGKYNYRLNNGNAKSYSEI